MGSIGAKLKSFAAVAAELAAEALWPSRCAICDEYGPVLCASCARKIPFVDQWRACPRCGAPFGLVQCSECNTITLGHLGRAELPYEACASAVMFDRCSGRLIYAFKDQGEQRLARAMAWLMCRAAPPSWSFDLITYIPASLASYRRRGFEHAGLIASEVAGFAGMSVASLFERPHTLDQRGLTREQRIANLRGRFRLERALSGNPSVLLIDDVYTTGATLCDATDALLAAGAGSVKCLTFARV